MRLPGPGLASSLLLLSLIATLGGCDLEERRRQQALLGQQKLISQRLDRMLQANPLKDVAQAIQRKHYRFYSVCGIFEYCPGLDPEGEELAVKYGYETVNPTCDTWPDENERISQATSQYIQPFNRQLANFLKNHVKETLQKH